MRTLTLHICLAAMTLPGVALAGDKTVTWTGWFADMKCASAHAAAGTFGPTNPECSKTCIQQGTAPVFISEQAKAIFPVKGGGSVIENLGYHIEVTGTVDTAANTIVIRNLKTLAYEGAACSRPKKAAQK